MPPLESCTNSTLTSAYFLHSMLTSTYFLNYKKYYMCAEF
jgi:hypothetical protein